VSAVLLDTDVASFIFKQDTRMALYQPYLIDHSLMLSFMSLAELHRWALERDWGDARLARMEQFLRRFIIHPFDAALCHQWAEITDGARRKGRPIQCADAWIAATALLYDIPLLTHNAADYVGVEGLSIISKAP
jgi:predicted nucleic acid-binding protein